MINRGGTNKQTKIKLSIVLLSFAFLFSIIVIRFYIIQISQKEFFKDIAKKQYSTEISVMPPRANIYDRNGKKNSLAINKEITSAFVLPQELSDQEGTLKFLKKHFKKVYVALENHPKRKFLWVERNVSPKTRQLIRNTGIKDIHYLNETQRYYPYKELSQVVGFTDIDNNGISGLEFEFNKKLSGTPSTLKIEKDARHNKLYFTKELLEQGTPGENIHLTIDSNLQFLAAQEVQSAVKKFEAKSGSAIIMDPTNGHILAMANYPYPENKNSSRLTNNSILSDCYEFGSVIKTFAALAALEEQVTTTSELIDCEGKVAYIDRFKVENWKHLEVLTFADVVRYSSNVGMAKIAKRLGTKQYDNLIKLGFGQATNIEFPGDRTGFVSPPHKWSKSSQYVLSFGYEINATLLQLAKAFSIISNNGLDVQPRLVLTDDVILPGKRLYRQESIDQIKDILEGIGELNAVKGYRIMGKTGTARMVEDGKYSNRRHIYTYAGMVERDNYKRVVVTFIKEPRSNHLWASQVSAPIFQKIAEKMVLYDMSNT